jgi:hypothetical protein
LLNAVTFTSKYCTKQLAKVMNNIVAFLLKAGTVEAKKQPLLGTGPYTLSRRMLHLLRDVTQQ